MPVIDKSKCDGGTFSSEASPMMQSAITMSAPQAALRRRLVAYATATLSVTDIQPRSIGDGVSIAGHVWLVRQRVNARCRQPIAVHSALEVNGNLTRTLIA